MQKTTLTQGKITAYGFLLFTTSLPAMLQMMYINVFMTDFAMIPPAVVATTLLIARIVDFIFGFLAGPMVEKIHLPWGKYRSWLLLMRWIAMVGIILEFVPSGRGTPLALKVAIAIVGYCFYNIGMSLTVAPYYALGPMLAGDDMKARMALSARGQMFMTASMLIVSAITVPFVTAMQALVSPTMGYMVCAVIYCIPLVIGCQLVNNISREVDPGGVKHEAKNTVGIKEMVAAMGQNKYLLILIIAQALTNIASNVGSSIGSYYWIYVVGNFLLMSLASTIGMVFSLIFSTFVPRVFASRVGKRKGMIIGLLAMGIFGCLKFFCGANWPIMVVFNIVASFFGFFYSGFGANYFIDAAEAHLYKTGKDLRTVAAALYGIPLKLGFMFGGAIASYGLAAIGYEAGMVFDPAMTTKFLTLFHIIPGAVMIIAAIIFAIGYNLTDEQAAMYAKANYEKMIAAQGGPAPAPAVEEKTEE
ncbi:MAG: MFS transporter [Eubacterium sp.]|nr:MFS transporter [Eubacterium sp.]